MPNHSGNRGFTLIEVLIVTLIIAIAAGLAVPMIGQTGSSKLRAAASLLEADLAFTQIESMAHADDTRVIVFDASQTKYHIAAASDTATPITNPVGNTPYTTVFGKDRATSIEGVTIESHSLDGDNILGFGIYGQLDQTTDATITLLAGDKRIQLTVDANTGDVTISDIY